MTNLDLNKINVAPQIVIYRGLLSDSKEILEVIKNAQSSPEENSFLPPWENWNASYNSKGQSLKLNPKTRKSTIKDNDSDIIKKQKQSIFKIYKALEIAKQDYVKSWAGKGIWPKQINNWEVDDQDSWPKYGMDILSYSPAEGVLEHDPKFGVYNLTMNYHIDANPDDMESAGNKLGVTLTVYLNDDYKGGELSLYDSTENKVYNYKPKAGDITVFPSSHPFYHGVLEMSEGTRYLIRSFLTYKYIGSEEWNSNRLMHEAEEWESLEKERLTKAFKNSNHNVSVMYEGDAPGTNHFKKVFVNSDPINLNEVEI